MNEPKRPVRSTSSPSSHLGHLRPILSGAFIISPSLVRAPVHSGKRAQLINVPLRPSLYTIAPSQVGQVNSLGVGPRSVTLGMSALEATSFAKGV